LLLVVFWMMSLLNFTVLVYQLRNNNWMFYRFCSFHWGFLPKLNLILPLFLVLKLTNTPRERMAACYSLLLWSFHVRFISC
jgi:hypothetical protein